MWNSYLFRQFIDNTLDSGVIKDNVISNREQIYSIIAQGVLVSHDAVKSWCRPGSVGPCEENKRRLSLFLEVDENYFDSIIDKYYSVFKDLANQKIMNCFLTGRIEDTVYDPSIKTKVEIVDAVSDDKADLLVKVRIKRFNGCSHFKNFAFTVINRKEELVPEILYDGDCFCFVVIPALVFQTTGKELLTVAATRQYLDDSLRGDVGILVITDHGVRCVRGAYDRLHPYTYFLRTYVGDFYLEEGEYTCT